MKKSLLIIAFLLFAGANAQVPITSFFGTAAYNYTNLNPAIALSHTTTGANAVWTFNSIPTNGTSSEINLAATTAEITTFPGTTSIRLTTTDVPSPSNSAKIYNKLTSVNVFSLTGFDANGVILNYTTNNALIGTFPLNFGYTNTDNTAGTFTYQTTTGTFTGTIKTDYDSFGTLNLGIDGFLPITKTVYRIKVFQNINLTIGFLPIGTVTQTAYTYYYNNSGLMEPFFRDTTFTVNVAALGDPQNTNQAQVVTNSLISLSTASNEFLNNSITIYPNPAQEIVTIDSKNEIAINKVSITDLNGRKVFESNNFINQIDTRNLCKGMYLVKITTETGFVTKKLVKQ